MYLPSSCLANIVKRAKCWTRGKIITKKKEMVKLCVFCDITQQKSKHKQAGREIPHLCSSLTHARSFSFPQSVRRTGQGRAEAPPPHPSWACPLGSIKESNSTTMKKCETQFKNVFHVKKSYQLHLIYVGNHCLFFWHVSQRTPRIPETMTKTDTVTIKIGIV